MSSSRSSDADTGGKRGSVVDADTAQRGMTTLSGSPGSSCPMQPRRSPRLGIDTNAPPRRRSRSALAKVAEPRGHVPNDRRLVAGDVSRIRVMEDDGVAGAEMLRGAHDGD